MKEIKDIKKEMLHFRDFMGEKLLEVENVLSCNTKDELENIIDTHETHLEMILNDAQSHLSDFKTKLFE